MEKGAKCMLQSVTPGNFVAITCWRMLHEKWCFTGIIKLTEEENKGFENGPFTQKIQFLPILASRRIIIDRDQSKI